MTVRVGINGFGRIGRAFLRCVTDSPGSGIEVVAVNDLARIDTLAYLLRHDSTYGPWERKVEHDQHTMVVQDQPIRVTNEVVPGDIDWKAVGAEVVIEATGRFRTREAAAEHLVAGARKVLISAPGKDCDATVVVGVNDEDYDPLSHDIVSAASCTTNCLAPMVAVLDRNFGVRNGLMTTLHSYTGGQHLLDNAHKDLRRGRSAAVNLVPTTTGAAKAIDTVLPWCSGRIGGLAVRAPVVDGSLTDLTVELTERVPVAEINDAFRTAAEGWLSGVLRYNTDPIVSSDIIGDPASCVFDATLTQARSTLVKVFGWYDNEWGYTNRLVDLVGKLLPTV
ncbi:type I glyceraldehyde-3-phosphate dehydrogenase [Allokutzneria sp. NRRL B-24872]|uniref:type I glyceraldehyde-3-phosphate dehydrogenase n=1 Tax=Allokutzneria sp. NRRL B-24872 TaxID=1137961 RepID=UPI000A392021|nr:type I glyceraldehyde-3-phosphate dehydrogenase [Allokutzneria sp. NRRL B-24872]